MMEYSEILNDPRPYSQRLENAYTCTIEPVTVIDPLKGKFTDYLTGLEPSGVVLDDYDWNLMPFKWRNKSKLDLDQFKADCEEIDRG